MGLTAKSPVLYDTSHRVGPCTNSAPMGLSPFTSLWLVTDNTGTHHVVNGPSEGVEPSVESGRIVPCVARAYHSADSTSLYV